MKFEELNSYKYTGNNQYPLNDNNYLVAVKEDSIFSDRNVVPLYYIQEDNEILGIDEEEIGNRILVSSSRNDTVTEDISTRFTSNEFFKICRGRLNHNENREHDLNLPQKWIFKSNLQPFQTNELVEIFDAEIDVKKSRMLY